MMFIQAIALVAAMQPLKAALQHPACAARAVMPLMMATSSGEDLDLQKRKDIAKARRAVASQGKGGMKKRAGAKRSEQKVPSQGKGFAAVAQGKLNFDRRPKPEVACACGSGRAYAECCAVYHGVGSVTTDPETLVRARYSAYRYRLPDFLMQTTDPQSPEWDADHAAWKRGLLGFCDDFEFQTLHVEETTMVGEEEAQVAFRADFCQKGTLNLMTLCETSSFVRHPTTGAWLYANGQVTYDAQR